MNQGSPEEAPGVTDVHKRASSYGVILAGITVIILYGSLFPFIFTAPSRQLGPVDALFSTWRSLYGWGDVLVNVMLYVPFGFFLVRAVPSGSGLARLALAGFAGLTLCTSIEIAQ